MRKIITFIAICLSVFATTISAQADASLVGLTTSGVVASIDPATGALTEIVTDPITSFELGAIARSGNKLFYVAAPSGTSQIAIFTVNTKTNLASHVDLDRDDDHVTALFFGSGKLHGIFYNSNTGSIGVYRINPLTGVTKLVLDLSSLSAVPIGGAISRIGEFYFTIVKPTEATRQLVRFKLKSGTAKAKDIHSADGTPVLCDRLKPIFVAGKFVCLASPSSTQVDVCKLNPSGVAKCSATLTNTERIAGGHTLMHDGKSFYAFVYAPNENNNQHLIKFTSAGVIKGSPTIANGSLFVGARFGKEEDLPPAS